MTAQSNFAANDRQPSLADLHERLGKLLADSTGKIARPQPEAAPWDARAQHLRGLEVTENVRRSSYATEAQLAGWRAETPPERQARLEAEWAEGVRQSREDELERIRVKYGRGSREFRRAAMRCVGGTLASKIGEVI